MNGRLDNELTEAFLRPQFGDNLVEGQVRVAKPSRPFLAARPWSIGGLSNDISVRWEFLFKEGRQVIFGSLVKTDENGIGNFELFSGVLRVGVRGYA